MKKSLIVAAAFAVAVAMAQTASTNLEIIKSRLTANDLKADISFLASDALEGRGTPSRGLEIASEYIAAQFRRAGLEPAGDNDYFQTAHYVNLTPSVEGMDIHGREPRRHGHREGQRYGTDAGSRGGLEQDCGHESRGQRCHRARGTYSRPGARQSAGARFPARARTP